VTWLVWRQHRSETIAATFLLVVLALVVLPSGLHLHQIQSMLRAGHCENGTPGPGCIGALNAFYVTSKTLTSIVPWLNLLPGLAGVFIGGPLVSREIEEGTWRLAWSQGVTRRRWLRGQLIAGTALVALAVVVFTIVVTWWLAPLNHINGRLTGSGLGFDFYGTVPAAWALFAFAIGMLAGTLARRVVPAIAISFGAYLAVRLPVEFFLRPRYLPPVRTWGLSPEDSNAFNAGNWVLSQDLVAPHSHHILSAAEQNQVESLAQSHLPPGKTLQNLASVSHYFQAHGYTYAFTSQPVSRFWAFQGIETGICIALAALAVFVARRWVLRRLT
jgi:hypothetical protein